MASNTNTPNGNVILTNGLGSQSGINQAVTPSAPIPSVGNQSNVQMGAGLKGVSDVVNPGTTYPYPLPEHVEEGDLGFDGTVDHMNIVFKTPYRGVPSLQSLDIVMTNAGDEPPAYLVVNSLTLNGATVQAAAAVAMTVHYKFSRREGN